MTDSQARNAAANRGLNLYRDADGNVIGPDVFIDGEPYEGTPLRSKDEEESDDEDE